MKTYADTRAGQLHCLVEGQGAPLLLLPGAGQTHPLFRNQIAALAGRHRVIAVDLPGSGMSAPLPADSSFASLAALMIDVLDHFAIDRADVYGIHTGNKIGAALCAGWPARVGDFCFSGQSHSIIADQAARNAHMRAVTAQYFPAIETDPALRPVKAWADAFTQIGRMWWRPELFAAATAAQARQAAIAEITDKLQAMGSVGALYEANFAYDLRADLARLPRRTLIVEIATPEEDRAIGRQGPSLLGIVPHADLVTFEEPGGIGLTLDHRAGELAAAIERFLNRAPAAPQT